MEDGTQMRGTPLDQFARSLPLTSSRFRGQPRRLGRGRGEARTTPRSRGAGISVALRRLEREHVALLLALCELESPHAAASDPLHAPTAMREALRVLLRDDLARVQHALALAAEGRYGSCEDCARPLSRRALEIRPATTRCESCEGMRG